MEKKTKIVATISDLNCSVEFLTELFKEGMDVVRINTAHLTPDGALNIVRNVRAVSERIGILIDTKGPELRVTGMAEECDGGVSVRRGQIVRMRGTSNDEQSNCNRILVNYSNFYNEVPIGASVLIDDGDLELVVTDKKDGDLICEVANDGVIKGRKSVNVPDVKIDLPSLTERDRMFINWAIDNEIDFIAHSFVRSAKDVLEVQQILDTKASNIKIISKIENREGVDNIDEILDVTYGIMVARGDLGVEIHAEQIPEIQRDLVKKCIESKKPVIIATQMLHSMISSPRPTRAEVSDVANAIYQRVDAIMLSGETASGQYPIEAVKTMAKIAREIEQHTSPIIDINMVRINNEITAQLARSAVRASVNLPIKAIVIDSLSGRTGRYLSAFRGSKTVYAICYRKHVMRELALSYGIYAEYREPALTHDRFLLSILDELVQNGKISREDLIVVVGGNFGAVRGASFMEIGQVFALVERCLPKHL